MQNIPTDTTPQIDLNIQWYPGHMAKTKRMLKEALSLVDMVVELVDARIPYSSKNPDLDQLAAHKNRIIVLNKADLANAEITKEWQQYFTARGFRAIITDSLAGKGLNDIIAQANELMQPKLEALRKRGRLSCPTRAMIAGIPNVGKSTLINRYAGKAAAKTADKPGVTRGKQWIKMKNHFELLDTPGILWPKFDDKTVGLHLAFTGAINDDIIDMTVLAWALIDKIMTIAPEALTNRYGISPLPDQGSHTILESIATARGFKLKGDRPDVTRASIMLLDEFRGGKLGRISLERPSDIPTRESLPESARL